MFYSYLFCFFSLDYRGGVDKGLGCGCAILKINTLAPLSAQSKRQSDTYIFDFLNGKVSVCRHTDLFWLYIYDDKKRVRGVSFEELIDLQIGCSQFRTGVVPAYQLLPSVDFLEHVVHRFHVIVIQEPNRGIFLVLLEGNYAASLQSDFFPLLLTARPSLRPRSNTVTHLRSCLILEHSCHRSALTIRQPLVFVESCQIGQNGLLLTRGPEEQRTRFA